MVPLHQLLLVWRGPFGRSGPLSKKFSPIQGLDFLAAFWAMRAPLLRNSGAGFLSGLFWRSRAPLLRNSGAGFLSGLFGLFGRSRAPLLRTSGAGFLSGLLGDQGPLC